MPVILHRETTDLKLAPYFGVYFKWLRARHKAGVRFLTQTRLAVDHRADLQILGDNLYVRLWGLDEDAFYFEFQTSGMPVMTTSGTQEGITMDGLYKAAIIGVGVSKKGFTAVIRGDRRQDISESSSLIKKLHQVNLIDEPQSYRNSKGHSPKYPSVLYDAWTPNHPFTGMFLRAYNWGGADSGHHSNRGPLTAHTIRDVGWDVPYMDSEGVSPVRVAYIRGDTDWPRANGRIVVKDDKHGEREFGVYVDSFNTIAVFPLAAITSPDGLKQNVLEKYVQRKKIELPGWVYQPTVKPSEWYAANNNTGLLQYPELDWKFHPDGDRACAVVVERSEANFDAEYMAVDPGTPSGAYITPVTQADFDHYCNTDSGYMNRHGLAYEPETLPQRYFIAPGVIEITLTIKLAGKNLEDYSFELAVREVRRPTTALYCTMVAGYVWYDIDGGKVAKRGDMVTLDLERYYEATWSNLSRRLSFFSVKNLTAGKEVGTWEGIRLLDFDLPTLSFVFSFARDRAREQMTYVRPGVTYPDSYTYNYDVVDFVAHVVTFNKTSGILYPDTMAQEQKDFLRQSIIGEAHPYIRNLVNSTPLLRFINLNDMRDWYNDPEMSDVRNYYAQSWHWKYYPYEGNYHPPAPSAAMDGFIWAGLYVYMPPNSIFMVDKPRFAWWAYADMIMNRMWVTPQSTFFVHPNGTWAFYDQQHIYNKHGDGGPCGGDEDTLHPFLEFPDPFEHVIFDHIHFVKGSIAKDTSFIELYNLAVQTRRPPNDFEKQEEFQTITKDSIRAKFDTSHTYTSNYLDSYQRVRRDIWLDLKITWGDKVMWYPEPCYQTGPSLGISFLGTGGGGGLQDLSMGGVFYEGPGYSGGLMDQTDVLPVTFSTCLLLQTK